MNKDAMDVDTAETIAGVVRLLRRAAEMAMRYQRAETDRDRALAKAMSEEVARAAYSVPSAETGNGSAV